MSYNGPQVKLYRPPLRSVVPYEDWKDDAACDGLPSYLFELVDELPPEGQHEAIAKGLKICTDCPVRQSCGNSATDLDRYWTTRGGQPPEGLFSDSNEPVYLPTPARFGFAKGEGPKREPKKTCKRGHNNWSATDKRGKRRCLTCRKLEYKGQLPPAKRSETCGKGHANWRVTKDGRRQCRDCINESRRAARAARKG